MKALIAGGGVAGAVAALALEKAGIESVIYESFDHGADGVGAFLTLAVNGIQALGAIEVDAAQLGGFETPLMALHLGDGTQLAEFPFGPTLPNGAVARTLKRAELYTGLRDEALLRGVRIEYGKRLVDAVSETNGVVAQFADGSEARGDLLIGADGLRSRVREIIDPRAPQARYVGLLNVGGYASGIRVPGQLGTMRMFFGKRCFFAYVPHPNGEVWWFANPARRRDPTKTELAAMTAQRWRDELNDLFADDAMPALAIIRATPEITAGWSTYDFPSVPRWHSGRMIIIGDAAHAASPSAGQGASMAIEDAVVLAQCLRDARGIEEAFIAYESARRKRVERIVAQGRRNGTGKTPGLLGRMIRDLALRAIFKGGGQRVAASLAWIFEHRIEWRESPP